jgi:hypothetical protein
MRWYARRPQGALLSVEPIDRVDPATLEVVAVDDDGRLHGPPPAPSDCGPREIGYAPRDRDPTGLAGVWEALASF